MFPKETYTLVCHACGEVHTKELGMLSADLIGFRFADGHMIAYPMYACQTCMDDKTPREQHPVYLAWRNGMSKAAYNRAAAILGALPREIDTSIPCKVCGRSGHLRNDGMHELCFREQRNRAKVQAARMSV